MNNFIKSSIGLVFGLILIIGGTKEVFAIGDPGNTIGDRLGCDKKISDQFKSGGKLDEKKLDDALERRGVPSSITVEGRTIPLNKIKSVNNCILVYGDEDSIPSSDNSFDYGRYQYSGYDISGRKIGTPGYHSLSKKPDNFLQILKRENALYTKPWTQKDLEHIEEWRRKGWTIKPIPEKRYYKDKSLYTQGMKELGRTGLNALEDMSELDGFYTNHHGVSGGPRGKRGYAGEFTPAEWGERSFIDFFPGSYNMGQTVSYRRTDESSDGVAYLTRSIPPVKKFLQEDISLKIEHFDFTNKSAQGKSENKIWEGDQIGLELQLKNTGELSIKNPEAEIEFNNNIYKIKFPGTLKPNKTTKTATQIVTAPRLRGEPKGWNDKSNFTARATSDPNGKEIEKSGDDTQDTKEINFDVHKVVRDLSVSEIEIKGDEYFKGVDDKEVRAKLFEGNAVPFRYKLKLRTNRPGDKVVDPVVKYGKREDENQQNEERIDYTLKVSNIPSNKEYGETESDWLYPTFDGEYDAKGDFSAHFEDQDGEIALKKSKSEKEKGWLQMLFNLFFITKAKADNSIESVEISEDDLKWKKVNGEIEITKYIGNDKNIKIPDEIEGRQVKRIGRRAFADKGLKSVELPNELETIYHQAFINNNIKEIEFPETIKFLGLESFGENELSEVQIPNEIIYLAGAGMGSKFKSPFINNSRDLKISYCGNPLVKEFGEKFGFETSIADDCVWEWKENSAKDGKMTITKYNGSKSEVEIPKKFGLYEIEKIDDRALKGKNLKSVTIPEEVRVIGKSAFANNNLSEVNLNGFKKIENNAFSHNNIKKIINKGSEGEISRNSFSDQRITLKDEEIGADSKVTFKLMEKEENLKINFNGRNLEYKNSKFNWGVEDGGEFKAEISLEDIGYSGTIEQNLFAPDSSIALCNTDGEFKEYVSENTPIEDYPSGLSPDTCDNETGLDNPDVEPSDPITEDDIEEIKDYDYEPEEKPDTKGPIAKEISGDNFREEVENIFVKVNDDKQYPKNEFDWDNNELAEPYKSVNKVYDISIDIVDPDDPDASPLDPENPSSNEKVTVTHKVCNLGNQDVREYKIITQFGDGEPKKEVYDDGIERGDYIYDETNSPQGSAEENCKIIKIANKMIDIETSDEDVPVRSIVNQGMPEGTPEDHPGRTDSDEIEAEVQNPNVSVYIQNENEEADVLSETGDAHIVIRNEMYRDIAIQGIDANGYENDPEGSKMNPSDTTKTVIKLRDENLDKEIATYTASDWDRENIGHGEIASIKVSDEIRGFIDRNYDGDYQSVEISVKGHIPYYKGEVDYSGNPKYRDNELDESIYYFPPRPNISMMQCNELDASAGQLGIGSDMPVKTCAGHYPNNPSTAVEEGMQAYHYVMYRFFPAPLPPYDIESVGTDNKHNPEYFNQIIKLEEHKNKRGDKDAFIFDETKTNNGAVSKRGRFLPTGATFDFSVTEKHGSEKGKTIASGTVEYNIPDSCYNSEQIDLKHQYGCDEIMLFVPNERDSFEEQPGDFEERSEDYPTEDSTKKIPYINPGLYEFKFDAKEKFDYFYQTNQGQKEKYYWSDVKRDR